MLIRQSRSSKGMQSFDYIIVGAGSAGCVLANRLTDNGRWTVLLLEYGSSDSSIFISMPAALSIPMNMPRYNWFYETEPEPHLNGRRLHTPRGKVLGGSSSINGLVYVRGNPLDFKAWPTSCPISAERRRVRKAATLTAAIAVRCKLLTGPDGTHSFGLGSRQGNRLAISRLLIAMDFSRKASAVWI
jgi:choline dehydrogenase-like flavoprotein